MQIVAIDDDDDAPTLKHDKCYLWPCNVATFNIWGQLQTQWNIGMSGASGLDYTAVIAYLRDVVGTKKKDIPELFQQLRAMEIATLNEWAKQQAKT